MSGLRRVLALPLAASVLVGAPSVLLAPPTVAPAQALELRGSTYFVRAPAKVQLLSYSTTVWEQSPDYYLTLVLPEEAGADLGALTVEQIRGFDTGFPYDVARTRAFIGRPRQEGPAVQVQAAFDERSRRFNLSFPEPVSPGRTLTVVLRPWRNPGVADTYLFQVTAYPAGPAPAASPVGVGTLRIYDRSPW